MQYIQNEIIMAKLSIQRALLGMIHERIRAIVFSVTKKELNIRFYFDGYITESDKEAVSCVETEILADYDSDYSILCNCLRLDAPNVIEDDGVWAYLRYEEYTD